jgi:colanic acid/amylovoran biosynthesis glycosyltransferase
MAATGMPIISTTHCDIPEIVRADGSALLAEEHDIDGLAAHLLRLARHPETWPAMGRAGREHAEAAFDLEGQGRALAAHYQEALAAAEARCRARQ